MTKNKILLMLENRRGEYLSGQELASELGLSRNAVWKAVKALKEDGVQISSVKNRGYMLAADFDPLTEDAIARELSERGAACELRLLKTVDSTNTYSKRLALESPKEPILIVSETQSAGRGRSGKSFHSAQGAGLYMSLLLHPEKRIKAPQLITVASAVSVCRAIEKQTGISPSIKWVNDIFCEGKKICGILTEAVMDFESNTIDYIVVGIGINCRVPSGGFPEEIRDIAGALPVGVSRAKLCADIAAMMIETYAQPEDAAIIEEYRRRCRMIGKRVSFLQDGLPVEAEVTGIDDDCALLVRFDNGKTLALHAGEISVRGAMD